MKTITKTLAKIYCNNASEETILKHSKTELAEFIIDMFNRGAFNGLINFEEVNKNER